MIDTPPLLLGYASLKYLNDSIQLSVAHPVIYLTLLVLLLLIFFLIFYQQLILVTLL